MILLESALNLTFAMVRRRSSAPETMGWLTKTRGLPVIEATVRCRQHHRRRIVPRRGSCAWRLALRAPSECRVRAQAQPDVMWSRRVLRQLPIRAAGYGLAPARPRA